jgi:hypothetical protein
MKTEETKIDHLGKVALVKYELMSSWWAPWFKITWMQKLIAIYYINKVDRKVKRYSHNVKNWK